MREWLQWFNSRMRGRRVLLLMDTLSAHLAAVESLQRSPLLSTTICWLPPDSIIIPRPLNQDFIEIVEYFQVLYRVRWLQLMSDEFGYGRQPLQTMNALRALR